MKYVLFTIILATLLLVTACGNDAEIVINDTTINDTNESVKEVVVEPPEEIIVEPPVVEKEPEPSVTIPDKIEILLDNIDVLKNTYGASEEHELTMILSTTQYDKIVSGTLSFKPLCNEDIMLFASINDHLLYRDTPACEEVIEVPITKDDLETGPNSIEFKNDIKEAYELIDTVVTFTYADGTSEPLPADDHFFEPADSDLKSVKDLGIVSITNTVERVFTLTEEELNHELYVGFDALEREGDMLILLNDHVIYEGTPRSKGHEIVLPLEHLNVGKNTLLFIGIEE